MVKKIKKKVLKYRDLHWLDKTLDVLLITGVFFALTLFVVERIFAPGALFSQIVNGVDIFVIGIFFAETGRSFMKSRNFFSFMKHHWLELIILTIALVSFSSIIFLGLGRVSYLLRELRILKIWK